MHDSSMCLPMYCWDLSYLQLWNISDRLRFGEEAWEDFWFDLCSCVWPELALRSQNQCVFGRVSRDLLRLDCWYVVDDCCCSLPGGKFCLVFYNVDDKQFWCRHLKSVGRWGTVIWKVHWQGGLQMCWCVRAEYRRYRKPDDSHQGFCQEVGLLQSWLDHWHRLEIEMIQVILLKSEDGH